MLATALAVLVSAGVEPRGRDASWRTSDIAVSLGSTPAQHAVGPARPKQLRNAHAVEKAVGFILSLQPEGSYVLTTPGVDDIVHMDVAHCVIALAKTGHAAEAEAATDWLMSKMTLPGDPDRFGSYEHRGLQLPVDYLGSWWDHFRSSGAPRADLTRGRGEGVGMALIATYTVYQESPDYLLRRLGPHSIADRVAFAASYLTSAAMQGDDGRFQHRPDYRVSFNEEGARMVLSLRLAAEMLADVGRTAEARQIQMASERGLTALLKGEGLSQGMAYDYYALGIWGLVSPRRARQELVALEAAGLVTSDGVRNWDWQADRTTGLVDRLRWWAQSQTVAPSQTFDWAIASITAGQIENALEVERRWLALQRPDGGFPDGYLPILGLRFGSPTSYAAARFIILERLLTEVFGGDDSLVGL